MDGILNIKGFYILTDNGRDIETVTQQMRNITERIAQAHYLSLVQKEVEAIVDFLALNPDTIRPTEPLIDIARKNVLEQIQKTIAAAVDTEYNLSAYIQHASAEIKPGKKNAPIRGTVLRLISPHDIYSKEYLKYISDLFKFDASINLDCEDNKYKHYSAEDTWRKVVIAYGQDEPYGCNLFNFEMLQGNILYTKMNFRSPVERAYEKAQEHMLDNILYRYSLGRDIQPQDLTRTIFTALKKFSLQSEQATLKKYAAELSDILPVITLDMIGVSKTPGEVRSNNDNTPSL